MDETIKILTDLKDRLQKNFGSAIIEVILFGSRQKGNHDQFSDYDILLILDRDYSAKDENRIFDICYETNLIYNIVLDIHILSKYELNTLRGKQPVYQKALSTGLYA